MTSKLKADSIIIVSASDIAGMNMRKILMEKNDYLAADFTKPNDWPSGEYKLHVKDDHVILLIPGRQIFTEYFKDAFDTKIIIFASKHFAASGKKALLAHTTGVFSEDTSHGGRAFELAFSPHALISMAYEKIKERQDFYKLDEYWTGIEVTHHGPTSLEHPVIFLEAGGTQTEWEDLGACRVIAETIIYLVKIIALDKHKDDSIPTFVGIGGSHYGANFIRQLDNKKYQMGHILPKYVHENIPDTIISELWDKTSGNNKIFAIDKKGCKSDNRKKFIHLIEELGYPWEFI